MIPALSKVYIKVDSWVEWGKLEVNVYWEVILWSGSHDDKQKCVFTRYIYKHYNIYIKKGCEQKKGLEFLTHFTNFCCSYWIAKFTFYSIANYTSNNKILSMEYHIFVTFVRFRKIC